jgi:subtilisin family serine protease
LFSLILVWMGIALLWTPPTGAQDGEPHQAGVDARLAGALAQASGQESIPALVILAQQPDPQGHLARAQMSRSSKQDRGHALYAYLTDFARTTQAPLRAMLDEAGVSYRPFYIINAIQVTGDAGMIQRLRSQPEVQRVLLDQPFPGIAPMPMEPPIWPLSPYTLRSMGQTVSAPYGIHDTNAPQVWEMGYRGAGIVIASQDTGVDWTHAALRPNYRGWDAESETADHVYSWYDPWGTEARSRCDPDPQVPCDDGSHGTHTVGTMVGVVPDLGSGVVNIGMAPDASWIGCRNMKLGDGRPSSYAACFQFFFAPHPQDGDPFTEGDPSRAPDVINNSWYCPPSEECTELEMLRPAVQAVHAAGIMVIGSAGNFGGASSQRPEGICGSVQYQISIYPEVFAVAAHDSNGNLASFSSRGPVTVDGSGRFKPQLSAPGVSVQSTVPGDRYAMSSGTSMSSPHVAGAVALLWSAAPELRGQPDLTGELLMKSAARVNAPTFLYTPANGETPASCVLSDAVVSPNTLYGFGYLDVKAAVELAQSPGQVIITPQLPNQQHTQVQSAALHDLRTGYVYRDFTRLPDQRIQFDPVYAGQYRIRLTQGETQVDRLINVEPGAQVSVTLTVPVTLIHLPMLINEPE